MAILPKIVYNFNGIYDGTVGDLSENSNNGTLTGVAIEESDKVGNDAAFKADTDRIDLGNITYLNGSSECSIHLGIRFNSDTGIKNIFDKHRQIEIRFDNSTKLVSVSLHLSGGVAIIYLGVLAYDTFYDIDVIYSNDILYGYLDGTLQATDSTKSGAIVSRSDIAYIGNETTVKGQLMNLNEFKLYNEAIPKRIIDSVIASPNGVLTETVNDFVEGDIIAADLKTSPKYAIVSLVDGDSFRFMPLTGGILPTNTLTRVGHLWDDTRQYYFEINKDPSICFYDGVSLSSEVLTDAKKVYCLNKNGIIKGSKTITTNYTALSSDQLIYVDSSGGAFTLTLESNPIDNKVIEVIDSTGGCGTNTVVIDGNGNNIIGNSNATMVGSYIGYQLTFNGSQWNLK